MVLWTIAGIGLGAYLGK